MGTGPDWLGMGTVPNYGEEVIRMRRLGTVPDTTRNPQPI
jgi:hypothetical protein